MASDNLPFFQYSGEQTADQDVVRGLGFTQDCLQPLENFIF
jgi:hypothetical protein